jgi:dipeptidyl aminopeptidase/acylaminoacyl peptidase
MPGYVERTYIDDSASAKLLKNLEQAFPGQRVTIRNVTRDGQQAVVFVRSDRNAGEYYIFDTETLKAGYVASPKPKLDPLDMGDMKPFSFNARDGMTIHGYITLPKGYDGSSPLPTIMNIHGGPHGVRDDWGFSDENQFFANRGYAVVQVNFRGSGGYGQEFIEAGYRKWGREMQDDVTDATLWAIEQGYADKDRICIYGGSYGGYASLMGVVREPDLYQCSVGYVGVYSLPVMKTDGDIPSRESGRRYLSRVLGDEKAELEANSPALQVNRIKVPLYIVHGKDDVRVPMAQYNALTRALKAAKKPYKSMVRDEGHGFQKEQNRFDLYRELELFFAEHIGGQRSRK